MGRIQATEKKTSDCEQKDEEDLRALPSGNENPLRPLAQAVEPARRRRQILSSSPAWHNSTARNQALSKGRQLAPKPYPAGDGDDDDDDE